jgi:tRNA U55 pseudouridine synthase TruB
LRRTVSGPFALSSAVTLDALEAMDVAVRDALLLPVDAPLAGLARVDVDASTAEDLVAGRVGCAAPEMSGRCRCYGPQGRFLGLVEASAGELRSVRLTRTEGNP